MQRISPVLKAKLPPVQAGWFDYRYSILADGSLAVLRATYDVRSALRERHAMMAAATVGQPLPPLCPEGTMARLSVFDGTAETAGFEFELESSHPLFDRLDDRRWLVVAAPWMDGGPNARIFDNQGSVERRFCLGDGIEHLQCDARRNIWVGYFDEGVFGNDDWTPDTALVEARLGINRFDEHGRMSWAYPNEDLADCYAMNVTPEAVWACYYPYFPILRIGWDGSSRLWENSTKGAHLLAVDGADVVLLGLYAGEARVGRLVRLTDETSPSRLARCLTQTRGEFVFDLNGHEPRRLDYHGARGDKIHFVHDGNWYVLSVGQIVRAFE